jgi:hypothetical protein
VPWSKTYKFSAIPAPGPEASAACSARALHRIERARDAGELWAEEYEALLAMGQQGT